jgi:hypothetical protein
MEEGYLRRALSEDSDGRMEKLTLCAQSCNNTFLGLAMRFAQLRNEQGDLC